jgi:SP family general alpha glucoside:H+ symporter-like MFS transporter
MIQPSAAGGWGWGPLGAGFFYAGTNLLSMIWCWFRLPETKVSYLPSCPLHEADDQDRTFGEIDVLFEHKIPARKFKYTKADRESPCDTLWCRS